MWGILSLEERRLLAGKYLYNSVHLSAVAQAGSVQGKPPWMDKEEGEVKFSGG